MKSSPPSTRRGRDLQSVFFVLLLTFSRKRDITSVSTFLASLPCIALLCAT